ncbi:MAG: aminotransferase class V-fold PLP-dependent enzyme [Anaerolineales bacterium]|nr:aminotransferase class V-fold PLP-dependent enzyme [Anaerolineales bacterium]
MLSKRSLYARYDLIPTLQPTTLGWFSQANIFAMDIYANTPSPTARRFEAGSPPVPNIYAGVAGIKLIQSVGLEKIEAHLADVNRLMDCLTRHKELLV